MAVLAVVGNMITTWSWFGTNQLGVGLHAYGFNNTLALGCTVFWGIQICFLVLGLAPFAAWKKGYLEPTRLPTEPTRLPEPPRSNPGSTAIMPG